MDNFLTYLIVTFNLPSIVLFLLLGMFLVVAVRAQGRNDFDWANALKDENGKESAFRLGIFIGQIVATWLVIYFAVTVVNKPADLELFFNYFLAYVGLMIFPKIVEQALAAIIGTRFGGPKP